MAPRNRYGDSRCIDCNPAKSRRKCVRRYTRHRHRSTSNHRVAIRTSRRRRAVNKISPRTSVVVSSTSDFGVGFARVPSSTVTTGVSLLRVRCGRAPSLAAALLLRIRMIADGHIQDRCAEILDRFATVAPRTTRHDSPCIAADCRRARSEIERRRAGHSRDESRESGDW